MCNCNCNCGSGHPYDGGNQSVRALQYPVYDNDTGEVIYEGNLTEGE